MKPGKGLQFIDRGWFLQAETTLCLQTFTNPSIRLNHE